MQPATIVGLLAFVYLLNLPFGYWRRNTSKLSKQWILAIHLPVPLIFAVRLLYGVGLELIPFFILAFFLGQFSGGRIRSRWEGRQKLTSCLVMDFIRLLRKRSG
jgi:pilus assembly protein TadC